MDDGYPLIFAAIVRCVAYNRCLVVHYAARHADFGMAV